MIELSHIAGPVFTGVDGTLVLFMLFFATLAPYVFGAWVLLLGIYILICKLIKHHLTIKNMALPAGLLLVLLWALAIPVYKWYDNYRIQADKNSIAVAKLKKTQFRAELPQRVDQACQSKRGEITGLKATAEQPSTYRTSVSANEDEEGLYVRYKATAGEFRGYGIRELRLCPGVTPKKNNVAISVYMLATGRNLEVSYVPVDVYWYATQVVVK